MRLWSEVWTKDNALHIAAGLPVIALLYFSGMVDYLVHGAALYGLILYIREVTQVQCKDKWSRFYHQYFDLDQDEPKAKMDGTKGWLLDLHHNMEWMVPTVALMAAAWIIDFYIN